MSHTILEDSLSAEIGLLAKESLTRRRLRVDSPAMPHMMVEGQEILSFIVIPTNKNTLAKETAFCRPPPQVFGVFAGNLFICENYYTNNDYLGLSTQPELRQAPAYYKTGQIENQ